MPIKSHFVVKETRITIKEQKDEHHYLIKDSDQHLLHNGLAAIHDNKYAPVASHNMPQEARPRT